MAHDDAPLADWYVEAGQGKHCALPAVAAIDPAEQRVGSTEPAMHAVPAGRVHWDGSERSVALEEVPAGQGTGVVDPKGQ